MEEQFLEDILRNILQGYGIDCVVPVLSQFGNVRQENPESVSPDPDTSRGDDIVLLRTFSFIEEDKTHTIRIAYGSKSHRIFDYVIGHEEITRQEKGEGNNGQFD